MRVVFTEQMKGFHTAGSPAYDAGYVTGRRDWHRLGFELTIGTDDLAPVLADPLHRMPAHGYVTCAELAPGELAVEDGTFDLFCPGTARHRFLMRYRLPFAAAGRPLTLLGFKDVGNDGGFDAWPDTTTLYTRVVHGVADFDAPPDQEYSRGILRLDAWMFARQLSTFRGSPWGLARFGGFFLGKLATAYTTPPARM